MAILRGMANSWAEVVVSSMLAASILIGSNASANDEGWQLVDPGNIAVLQVDGDRVVIELNPEFAPATVNQFRRLAREGFYDGQSFYRVIDGFVAQGGDGSDMGAANNEPTIPPEFERDWTDDIQYVRAQSPDLFAPEAGFVNGFPVAADRKSEKIWLTHCPGAIAMARLNAADSSSTDFYVVIGQAPRYLDRNLSVFGRVVVGLDVLQRLPRGSKESNGILENIGDGSIIDSVRILSDRPQAEQFSLWRVDTNSPGFSEMLDARRNRDAEFFVHKPPAVIDVCQVPLSGRIE